MEEEGEREREKNGGREERKEEGREETKSREKDGTELKTNLSIWNTLLLVAVFSSC